MNANSGTLPRFLVAGVLLLMLLVLGLGGAVIAVKLRPAPLPTNAIDRNIALWERAVEDDPSSSSARTGLGLVLVEAGRLEEAKAAFEEAIRLDPGAWMAKFQLGLLIQGSDPERAVSLIHDAASQAPDQDKAVPLVAEGDLCLDLGDPEAARDAYRRSLAFNPFTFEGHLGLARALEEMGREGAALDEYREAERFDPGNPVVAEAIERLES